MAKASARSRPVATHHPVHAHPLRFPPRLLLAAAANCRVQPRQHRLRRPAVTPPTEAQSLPATQLTTTLTTLATLATLTLHPTSPAYASSSTVTTATSATAAISTIASTAGAASDAATTTFSAVAAAADPAVFVPQLPDPSILAAQGLVLLLTTAAGAYWWLVVVPTERAAVGRSKRLGRLNEYLGELEQPQAADERRLERWFYTDWLQQRQQRRERLQQGGQQQQQQPREAIAPTTTTTTAAKASDPDVDPYDSDRPYDDNLLRPTAATPTPRFFSLDNPIVATAALLLLAGAGSALLSPR